MNIPKIKNSERIGLIVGIFLILLSFFLGILPIMFSLDMMQWGYGMVCIGLFIFIIGAITFFMYLYRFKLLRSIINGEEIIVHWVYSKEKFLKQAKIEFEKSKMKIKLNLVLSGFSLYFLL